MTDRSALNGQMQHNASVPPPRKVEMAMSRLAQLRAQLIADDPDMERDERLLADTLEGEGGNAIDVLDRMLRAAVNAGDMADASYERAAAIKARGDRYERRSNMCRQAAMDMLEALGLTRRELPDLTASIAAGRERVVIIDEKLLDDAYVRVKREPDKTAIGTVLKSGGVVTGAVLSNPSPTLQIRTR